MRSAAVGTVSDLVDLVAKPKALVIGEEKGVVFLDRTAEGSAKLVLHEVRHVARVPHAGIEKRISKIFVKRTVEHIRARASNNVNLRSAGAAELSRIIARLHLEFLNGIRRRAKR